MALLVAGVGSSNQRSVGCVKATNSPVNYRQSRTLAKAITSDRTLGGVHVGKLLGLLDAGLRRTGLVVKRSGSGHVDLAANGTASVARRISRDEAPESHSPPAKEFGQ